MKRCDLLLLTALSLLVGVAAVALASGDGGDDWPDSLPGGSYFGPYSDGEVHRVGP